MNVLRRLLAGLLLASAIPVGAADLDRARMFHENGLLEDAKRELIAIATSDAEPETQASALHLLGTIASEERRYEQALRTWGDLVRRFPDSSDADQVRSKIPLVQALMEANAASSGGDRADVPAPYAGQSGPTGVVLIGSGSPAEYVEQSVTEVMNMLGAAGVRVSRGAIGAVSVSELLAQNANADIDAVLVLSLRFGYIENLRADCYDRSGILLWEEKAAGSMGFTKAGITQGLIERIIRKLEPHVGGPCLPRQAVGVGQATR